jgi:hypothetical protein
LSHAHIKRAQRGHEPLAGSERGLLRGLESVEVLDNLLVGLGDLDRDSESGRILGVQQTLMLGMSFVHLALENTQVKMPCSPQHHAGLGVVEVVADVGLIEVFTARGPGKGPDSRGEERGVTVRLRRLHQALPRLQSPVELLELGSCVQGLLDVLLLISQRPGIPGQFLHVELKLLAGGQPDELLQGEICEVRP